MDIDVAEIQQGYDKPVLIIHGDDDQVVPIEYSREAEKRYKNVHLETISGAGHGFDGDDSVNARKLSITFVLIYEGLTDVEFEDNF